MTHRRIDNTMTSLLRESLRKPRAKRVAVADLPPVTSPEDAQKVMRQSLRANSPGPWRAVKPVESGMFAGERVSLPGDDVVRKQVALAVEDYRAWPQPNERQKAWIRGYALGAIGIAEQYLGATREVCQSAREVIGTLV
jgi:hypothetical protein